MRFLCSTCGKEHDIDNISFGTDAPVQWGLLTEDERSCSALSAERCKINSREGLSYYLRACLEIPIRGTGQSFTWGVWCSLSERSYVEISDHWDDPGRSSIGPHFGWLCTKIPGYPDTVFLKTMLHQRDVGIRPSVELEPTNHPLAVDQRNGIEQDRLRELVIGLLHREATENSHEQF